MREVSQGLNLVLLFAPNELCSYRDDVWWVWSGLSEMRSPVVGTTIPPDPDKLD